MFEWAVLGDGCELGCGILSLPVIEPQRSYDIEWKSGPWYPLWASSDAEEIFLTITTKLLHSKRWVEARHVVSSTQVQLPSKREIVPHVSSLLFLFLVLFKAILLRLGVSVRYGDVSNTSIVKVST